jgi:ribulose-5-phosphate 4-epimerase/fuculose-1-phosphate aldolase
VSALTPQTPVGEALVTVFRRLFESDFVTLDGFAISCRTPDGARYLDESDAVVRMLLDEPAVDRAAPGDRAALTIHEAAYRAWPEAGCAVSGRPLHLRAILAEGAALPGPTSMMRKRGVVDLRDHLVEPDALLAPAIDATIARARAIAVDHGMKHMLIVATDGTVFAAAPTPEEALGHFQNVGFAARVECIRVEEAALLGREG